MKNSGARKWLVIFAFCCVPLSAWANAGTGLMFATLLHMVIGNAIIGIGEGWALALLFRLNLTKCLLMMVAANYFSAWVGEALLQKWILPSLSLDLYNGFRWLRIMVGVTFVMTLLLEWPFVLACLSRTPGRFKKSLWGNLVVQSCSYLLLFGWYASASPTGLYSRMHVVQPAELSPGNETVFYIAASNGNICSLNSRTRQAEEIFPLHSSGGNDRLFIQRSDPDTNRWDVLADTARNLNGVPIRSNLSATAASEMRRNGGTWLNFGAVPKLGSAEQSDWNFRSGFWAAQGLRGKNTNSGETIQCSLETPFLQWSIRNAVQLPGDRVVFQLGDDQICLLEAATKRIALIARGRGPVVVIPTENAAQ